MKIVILETTALNPGDLSWDEIHRLGDVTLFERTKPEQAAERIGDAEIVMINKMPMDGALMDACPKLRLICVQATGYNVVDYEAAKTRGILVCNVPAYATTSVAQFAIGLILELCHQIGLHNTQVHEGKWAQSKDFCFWSTPQTELYGKTLGIIGYGSIGRSVGKIAKAFGMKVLAYSRTQYPEYQEDYADLDTVLSQSDIITIHCPLFPETTRLIRKETIAKMKDGAILINTSRGPILDEVDVAEALKSGKLGGAGLDVVCKEPITEASPLFTAPNCIITPHMAWAPVESRQRIMDTLAENIRAYQAGQPINVVNS